MGLHCELVLPHLVSDGSAYGKLEVKKSSPQVEDA